METIKNIISMIWHDPVLSKVFAGIILLFIPVLLRWILKVEILTIVILFYVLICLIFIYFNIGFSFEVTKALFSRIPKLIFLIGIITIPILFIAGLTVLKWYQGQPSDKIIILIANFQGPDPDKYRVTESIITQLKEESKEYNDVQIKALNQEIREQNGSDIARKKGEEIKASIVIWGWYGKTTEKVLVTSHFEVLQKSKFLKFRHESETISVPVTELERFTLQEQLSQKMTYLIMLTIGLSRGGQRL